MHDPSRSCNEKLPLPRIRPRDPKSVRKGRLEGLKAYTIVNTPTTETIVWKLQGALLCTHHKPRKSTPQATRLMAFCGKGKSVLQKIAKVGTIRVIRNIYSHFKMLNKFLEVEFKNLDNLQRDLSTSPGIPRKKRKQSNVPCYKTLMRTSEPTLHGGALFLAPGSGIHNGGSKFQHET